MTAFTSETWWAAYDGDHETWLRVRPYESDGSVVMIETYECAKEDDSHSARLGLHAAIELRDALSRVIEEYEETQSEADSRTLNESP